MFYTCKDLPQNLEIVFLNAVVFTLLRIADQRRADKIKTEFIRMQCLLDCRAVCHPEL